jgi:hypothetical protein
MSAAMTPPLLNGCNQLAYATTDLAEAMAVFRRRYAIPSFGTMGDIDVALEGGGSMRLRFALCFIGPTQYELIQPLSGRIEFFTRLFTRSAFNLALHHVNLRLPSVAEFEAVRAGLEASGHIIPLAGRAPSGGRFFYVDTRAELGHDLEYVYVTPERMANYHLLPHH